MSEGSLIKINPGLLAAFGSGGLNIDVLGREIVALECVVAGTSFRQLEDVEGSLSTTVRLDLKREPRNEHDAWAIALWFGNSKVGYIPRDKNEVLARLMDGGKSFYATIQAKEWEGKWLKLWVKVVMKG
jgi:hypothetical protein